MMSFNIRPSGGEVSLDVSLSLPSDGVSAIFGRSGAGKSSFFNCIAGIEKQAAAININGECWQKGKKGLSIEKRHVAFVQQRPYLFPHLTVEKNIKYAAKRQKKKKEKINHDALIEAFEIGSLLSLYPKALSGGELQRVALVQALMTYPTLLLLDEAFSALDESQKKRVMDNLKKILTSYRIPMIMISHSKEEIAYLADRVCLMENGMLREVIPVKLFIEDTYVPSERRLIINRRDAGYLIKVDGAAPIKLSVQQFNQLGNQIAIFEKEKENELNPI